MFAGGGAVVESRPAAAAWERRLQPTTRAGLLGLQALACAPFILRPVPPVVQ